MTLADAQGNVICGYGSDYAHYVFARIVDAQNARRWLADRLDRITYNASWGSDRPEHTLNIAFTYPGLVALGVSAERFRKLEAFTQGMAQRAARLGDLGQNAPEHWPPGLRDCHLVVTLTAWHRDKLEGMQAEVEEHLTVAETGLSLTYALAAARLPGAREHFGFDDGFSQPAIAGANTGPREGEGTLTRWRRWRELALGEFVLGYSDEGGLEPPAPRGPLGRDSTFMVVRRLEQDVAGFRTYVRQQAALLGRDEQWIAAKMVGRWPNGSALALHPDEPGPAPSDARESANDFRYDHDPEGFACPLGAHVRRANPRDALGWQGRLTQRHRLLRRGMSYGPPLADGATESDGHNRGLMFICFQASLERQFEFVQRQWLSDGNVFGLADDRDPLVPGQGRSSREMVIQGQPPLFLRELPQFVSTRGGDYFLLPGRTGLEALAEGAC